MALDLIIENSQSRRKETTESRLSGCEKKCIEFGTDPNSTPWDVLDPLQMFNLRQNSTENLKALSRGLKCAVLKHENDG